MVRSYLLPIQYKVSAEYCLPFRRLAPVYFKNVSEMTLNVCNAIDKQEISSSEKLQTIFVAKFSAYEVHE